MTMGLAGLVPARLLPVPCLLPRNSLSPPPPPPLPKRHLRNIVGGPVSCFSSETITKEAEKQQPQPEPADGVFDNLFLHLFRSKMVQETGWDSEKPGYDGLIEVATRLTIGRSNSEANQASVRILRSLFPPLLLHLYRILIAPIAQGKLAAIMVARVTALSCKWLMGPCEVNSVPLPDGTSLTSGVFVERCKYLEQSKCVGICINTCKLPTQTFFMDYMGVPLAMEPNFTDYSCQFKFGVAPIQPEKDSALTEPCLDICPNANRRAKAGVVLDDVPKCPKA